MTQPRRRPHVSPKGTPRALYAILLLSISQSLIYGAKLNNPVRLGEHIVQALPQAFSLLLAFWILLRITTRDDQKALCLAVWNGYLFFRFLDLAELLPYPAVLAVLFGAMAGGSVALLLAPRLRSGFDRAALVALHILFVMVAAANLRLVRFGTAEPSEGAPGVLVTEFDASAVPASTPDIFHVVVDAYGSNETFRRLYGFDNSEFTDFLESASFYVAASSISNYPQTHLSLHAVFEGDYAHEVTTRQGGPDSNPAPLSRGRPAIRVILEGLGYELVTVDSRTHPDPESKWRGGYDDLSPVPRSRIDIFDLSPARQILSGMFGPKHPFDEYEMHRQTILARVHGMKQEMLRRSDEPRLVHLHLLLPHPPFVFGPDGEYAADTRVPYYGYDGLGHPVLEGLPGQSEAERYRSAYVAHLRYANTLLRSLIDAFFASAGRSSALLIIQGDHGPASTWNLMEGSEPEDLDVRERFQALNAFYFPDQSYSKLYPSISLVNTYRVVLNQFFGQDYPLLEDRAYLASYRERWRLNEVTDLLRSEPRAAPSGQLDPIAGPTPFRISTRFHPRRSRWGTPATRAAH